MRSGRGPGAERSRRRGGGGAGQPREAPQGRAGSAAALPLAAAARLYRHGAPDPTTPPNLGLGEAGGNEERISDTC